MSKDDKPPMKPDCTYDGPQPFHGPPIKPAQPKPIDVQPQPTPKPGGNDNGK